MGGLKEYVAWRKYTMPAVNQIAGSHQSGGGTDKMHAQTVNEIAKEAFVAKRRIVPVITI
jgi:hypothetical protein